MGSLSCCKPVKGEMLLSLPSTCNRPSVILGKQVGSSTPFFKGTPSFLRSCSVKLRAVDSLHGHNRVGPNGLARCAVATQQLYGAAAVQGTGRPSMEDTFTVVANKRGSEPLFFGVFDGHGGAAVAELLKTEFWPVYKKRLSGADLTQATIDSYLEADKITLAQPPGLFGALRERGVGGSRCGSTAATVLVLPQSDGKEVLVAANVGDARVVLAQAGKAVQLTFDHKPDIESERKRIEAKNPTPKKPLVVNVGGIWRVGGLLALSRAFGDVYLKDWSDGKVEGASGGFGLTAEPHVSVQALSPEDQLVVLATDGLWENIENQEVVDICLAAGTQSLNETAQNLVKLAQKRGTTDDVTLVIVRLNVGGQA